MRSAIGIFGVAGALVLIAWVSRYGYKTAETEADALMSAFIFGFVTAGALFGHAIGARCWRFSKAVAAGWFVFSFVALVLSLSNSLGAIVSRSAHTTQDAITHNRNIEAAEKERDRLETLRRDMPVFNWVSAEAVDAAKTALANATTAKNAECGNGDPKQRGRNCKAKEDAEAAASTAFTEATNSRAQTDKAEQLDKDAGAERAKLATLGASKEVNQQGSAIARLFRMGDGEAGFVATAQQFGMAISVEVMIMLLMLAWEAMGREKPAPETQARARATPEPVELKAVLAPQKPEKPRLVSVSSTPVVSVKRVLGELLERSEGERVEIADLGKAYRSACRAENKPAATMEQFQKEIDAFCKAIGLKRKTIKGHLYLLNVRLIERPASTGESPA